MSRINVLIAVATELQKICEFEPAIKTKGKSEKELEKAIKEAAEALTPDDKLSAEALKLFKELKLTIGKASEPTAESEEEEEEEPADAPSDDAPEEEEEVEEEALAKSTRAAKAEKAEKPTKEKKEKKEKTGKPGVISFIVSLIEKADKKKGITKDQILEALKKEFADRNEVSMKATINVQVPARISKEKFEVAKTEKGGYYKK